MAYLTFKWLVSVCNIQNDIWMVQTKTSHLGKGKVSYAIILLGWRYSSFGESGPSFSIRDLPIVIGFLEVTMVTSLSLVNHWYHLLTSISHNELVHLYLLNCSRNNYVIEILITFTSVNVFTHNFYKISTFIFNPMPLNHLNFMPKLWIFTWVL